MSILQLGIYGAQDIPINEEVNVLEQIQPSTPDFKETDKLTVNSKRKGCEIFNEAHYKKIKNYQGFNN